MSGEARFPTYSLLGPRTAAPTEYEIVTSRLHYYVGRGFEVEVPLAAWYRQHQEGSALRCPDWEAFADPRETTYPKYTRLQKDSEEALAARIEAAAPATSDHGLGRAWLERLARVLPPLRYPFHGLMMIAAYVGQMAPSGRITMAALFQAADELRRIEHVARRMRQLHEVAPGFGADSRQRWQGDPAWQPAREAVERLLVTYDWGEAFVGLNLCLKPLLDDVAVAALASAAGDAGDRVLAEVLRALHADCLWQRDWTAALVRVAVAQTPANQEVIDAWVAKWTPPARRAAEALGAMIAEGGGA